MGAGPWAPPMPRPPSHPARSPRVVLGTLFLTKPSSKARGRDLGRGRCSASSRGKCWMDGKTGPLRALVPLSAPPPLPWVGVRELGPRSQVRVFPTLPPLQSKGGSSLLMQVETGPCWHLNSPTENFPEPETPSSGKDKSRLSFQPPLPFATFPLASKS